MIIYKFTGMKIDIIISKLQRLILFRDVN